MGWVGNATPRPQYPREWLGTHRIGDLVGPRAGLNEWGKSRPLPGFDPRAVHRLVSGYTKYTVPAPVQWVIRCLNAKNIRLEEIHRHTVEMNGEVATTEVNVRKWCWLFREGTINLLKPTGHVMHQQLNIQQLYVLPTLYLCVLYLSDNKQRLVPLTS